MWPEKINNCLIKRLQKMDWNKRIIIALQKCDEGMGLK